MTGKRRKTPENTKILQENTKKSSFIVLRYKYDVCTDYNDIYIYIYIYIYTESALAVRPL